MVTAIAELEDLSKITLDDLRRERDELESFVKSTLEEQTRLTLELCDRMVAHVERMGEISLKHPKIDESHQAHKNARIAVLITKALRPRK